MVTNGISSSGMSAALAAAQSAMIKAADPSGEKALTEAKDKGLHTRNAGFQPPVINQAARTGLNVMANRQISVGSGADRARAREAGGTIRNHFASATRALSALLNTAKTLFKRLGDYVFSPSAKESRPASADTAVRQKPQRTAAPGLGPRIE